MTKQRCAGSHGPVAPEISTIGVVTDSCDTGAGGCGGALLATDPGDDARPPPLTVSADLLLAKAEVGATIAELLFLLSILDVNACESTLRADTPPELRALVVLRVSVVDSESPELARDRPPPPPLRPSGLPSPAAAECSSPLWEQPPPRSRRRRRRRLRELPRVPSQLQWHRTAIPKPPLPLLLLHPMLLRHRHSD